MDSLREIAQRSGAQVRAARRSLVAAVRAASASGMSQADIAREIGRSQPEVSRLLRFHETGPLARRVRARRSDIVRAIAERGGSDVRVFGSVAAGTEVPTSDVDLLFHMGAPLGLMELGRLEGEIAELVGAPVDLVPDNSLAPFLRERVLAEAVPL